MNTIKKLDDVYNQCVAEGHLQEPEEIDIERAKSLLAIANFGMIWSSRYEIIRQLVQGILLLEKIKSGNHQCLYAYLCVKHEDWDIDWETIETMRILRNDIHYEGRPIKEETWKAYKLKFEVYTRTFISLLKEKLKKS